MALDVGAGDQVGKRDQLRSHGDSKGIGGDAWHRVAQLIQHIHFDHEGISHRRRASRYLGIPVAERVDDIEHRLVGVDPDAIVGIVLQPGYHQHHFIVSRIGYRPREVDPDRALLGNDLAGADGQQRIKYAVAGLLLHVDRNDRHAGGGTDHIIAHTPGAYIRNQRANLIGGANRLVYVQLYGI